MSDAEHPDLTDNSLWTDCLGQWQVVSGRLGVEEIPLPPTLLSLQATSYWIDSPEGRDEGRAEWRVVDDVVQLDLVGTGGTHAGQTLAAIARARGRVLQLSYAVDGSGRPHSFEARAGFAWVTVRYRRVDG